MKDEIKQKNKINNKTESNHNDFSRRRFLSRFREQDVIKYRTEIQKEIKTKPSEPHEQYEYHGYNTTEYISTLVKNLYI